MIDLLTSHTAWSAFLTLTALELVLGIDNIVFISILADRLPEQSRNKARLIGLSLAMIMRIALLFLLAWMAHLVQPLFTVFGEVISSRDLLMIVGGLFLLWKSTTEIHGMLEGVHGERSASAPTTFGAVITQIILIDVVFSVDSIITAIGLVKEIPIMVAAIVVSVILMMVFANPIGRFVSRHPTIKMLALAFLFTIGIVLIADGFDVHVPRGYIYSAMAFSIVVEALNLVVRKQAGKPVALRLPYARAQEPPGQESTAPSNRSAVPGEVILKSHDTPEEVIEFEKGRFETLHIGGLTVGRATYEPGWRWSKHVGPGVGEAFCTVEHVGLVLSGCATAAFADGRVIEMRPGQFFHIPAEPHDSWVVGDQPYVSLHFLGADVYARSQGGQ